MQRGLDWYKRDPIAFLDAIQGFGPELIGAYAVILDLIYARSGKIMRDDRHLSGVMGCSKRKAKILTDELIDRDKIQFHDGFITNSRAKREAISRRNLSETRSKQGRKGGLNSGEAIKNSNLDEAKASSKNEPEKSRVDKKNPTDSYTGKKDKNEPKSEKKKTARGIRLSPDWELSEEDYQFALNEGLGHDKITRIAAEFRDYWIGV